MGDKKCRVIDQAWSDLNWTTTYDRVFDKDNDLQ